MATLEDAAEELVVRLKGLDSEIEESEHALQDLRGRVEAAGEDVEQEWSHLTEAASSFLEKLHEEREQLAAEVRDTLQATADATAAIHEDGAQGRSSIAEAHSEMDALVQHVTGLEPRLELLVAETGEAPAQQLAERAKQVEQQLAQAVQEACEFLQEDISTGLKAVAEDIGERCQAVRDALEAQIITGVESAFGDWEAAVDRLEEHVAREGFLASRVHGRAVVEAAVVECKTACDAHLQATQSVVEAGTKPIEELAEEIERSSENLVAQAADLEAALDAARDSGGSATAALDSVKRTLAAYSFVEA